MLFLQTMNKNQFEVEDQRLKTLHCFKRSHSVPGERFPGMTASLRLISSTWEEMKEANRWCLSDVAADYLISLSNWPESGCICFASAELTYLHLISVSKSIWSYVFIPVSWGCWWNSTLQPELRQSSCHWKHYMWNIVNSMIHFFSSNNNWWFVLVK